MYGVCGTAASVGEGASEAPVHSASEEDKLPGGAGRPLQALESHAPGLGRRRRRQRPVRQTMHPFLHNNSPDRPTDGPTDGPTGGPADKTCTNTRLRYTFLL